MEEEIRKQAIRRHVIDGETPKSIYTSMNRSKKWFFKWLKRYQTGATDWYKEHSRSPVKKPSEISAQEKDLIISTRMRLEAELYAQIGVSAIKWEMKKLGVTLRSDSTVHRVLKQEGLIKKKLLMWPRELSTRILPRLFAVTIYTRWIWWVLGISRMTESFTRSTSWICTAIGSICKHSGQKRMTMLQLGFYAAGKQWANLIFCKWTTNSAFEAVTAIRGHWGLFCDYACTMGYTRYLSHLVSHGETA
jgi:transposase